MKKRKRRCEGLIEENRQVKFMCEKKRGEWKSEVRGHRREEKKDYEWRGEA